MLLDDCFLLIFKKIRTIELEQKTIKLQIVSAFLLPL